MWSLKYDTSELNICNRNRLRDIEGRLGAAKWDGGWKGDGLGVWGQQMQTIIYRMGKQQDLTVQHRELY